METRYCRYCEKELPATIAYFSPSDITHNRHGCRNCRKAQSARRAAERRVKLEEGNRPNESEDVIRKHPKGAKKQIFDRLWASAQAVDQEGSHRNYKTMKSIAARIGWSKNQLEAAVYHNQTPVYRFWYNTSEVLALHRLDAEAYFNNTVKKVESTRVILGSSQQCGVCNSEQGNILGDVNETTGEQYGFLCARCARLIRDWETQPKRLRLAAQYIEKTRR